MAESSKGGQGFDVSKYQIATTTKTVPVKVEETGDEFDVVVKQLSWSKRNQLISKCLQWNQGGNTSFDGDLYIRESLKEMIVEAPWGRTTEAFLVSIDERLGTALESKRIWGRPCYCFPRYNNKRVMAFLRGVGDTEPRESLVYGYWITVLQLLKIGIAWEAILTFTEEEVNMILGIESALNQKQQDDETRSMAARHGSGLALNSAAGI